MDIRAQYVLQNKLSFYQTPRFYEDTSAKNIKPYQKKIKQKRKSFFQDIIKANSKIPGVGKYSINLEQKPKIVIKKQTQIQNKPRDSYLDPLLKRSMSLPSVGKYDLIPKNKRTKKSYANVQKIQGFRPTVFDAINPDNISVSPGNYEIHKKNFSSSPKYSISPQRKKPISLPKVPSPGDYNPVPSSFSTFEKKSQQFSQYQNRIKNTKFQERSSLKVLVQSPGPIYNLITQWGKKDNLKPQFNIYKSISLPKKQSIYNVPQTAR